MRWPRPGAGLRDVLMHNYIGVNLEMVWHIVQDDLPTLKRIVDAVRADIEDQ